jgi:hypothetical protein
MDFLEQSEGGMVFLSGRFSFSFTLYSEFSVEMHKRLREFEEIHKRLREFAEI